MKLFGSLNLLFLGRHVSSIHPIHTYKSQHMWNGMLHTKRMGQKKNSKWTNMKFKWDLLVSFALFSLAVEVSLLLLFRYLHLVCCVMRLLCVPTVHYSVQVYIWNVYRVFSGSSLPALNWTLFSLFRSIHMCANVFGIVVAIRKYSNVSVYHSTEYVMPPSHVIGSFYQDASVWNEQVFKL